MTSDLSPMLLLPPDVFAVLVADLDAPPRPSRLRLLLGL